MLALHRPFPINMGFALPGGLVIVEIPKTFAYVVCRTCWVSDYRTDRVDSIKLFPYCQNMISRRSNDFPLLFFTLIKVMGLGCLTLCFLEKRCSVDELWSCCSPVTGDELLTVGELWSCCSPVAGGELLTVDELWSCCSPVAGDELLTVDELWSCCSPIAGGELLTVDELWSCCSPVGQHLSHSDMWSLVTQQVIIE